MDSNLTGSYRYDPETRKLVKVSDRIPNLSRFQIAGSRPYCAPGGETLDYGDGPIHVRDATEKRKVMQKYGVMEWQGKIPRKPLPKAPSFKEHFYKEHGTSFEEAGPSMIHVKEN